MKNLDEHDFPRRGELVVATVEELRGHGAYLHIEDYNIKGYLPITEISSKWVRRIDDVVKPGQKIVVKVLRIDRYTRSVDVSLKEVSEKEKERILRLWKRNKRGEQILDELKKAMGKDGLMIEEKLQPIIDKERTVYDALENILREPDILDKLTLKNKKKEIIEFLSKRIRLKKYVYEAIINAQYIGKGGVYIIRDSLNTIKEEVTRETGERNIKIFHDGAPRYKLRVWSYKPETIKRRTIPAVKETIRKLSKKLKINLEKEMLKVET